MINMLKSDFQNEIVKLKNINEKQSQLFSREKSKFERTIREMQSDLSRLKYLEMYIHLLDDNKKDRFETNQPKKICNE